MSDFELSGEAAIDVSEFVDGASDAADASEDFADSAGDANEALLDFNAEGAAAGGALAGAGTGAQSALDDTRQMREELNRAGQAAGFTQDEMVDLATDLSDGTLETSDAAGALGALSEQGVDTEDKLRDLTSTSDDIADAVGEDAEVIAGDLGPAMAAVGDDIEDMDDVADGVVSTINETNLEFGDFTRTVERSRDELNEMGLSTDETAALMGDFAEETGLSGRELRREFSSELEDADGDLAAFAESTGVNIDSQADLREALADSEGATEEYSKAVSDNTSLMDDLRVGFEDAKLQAGNLLGPVSAAAPLMQSLGIAALTLSTINFSAVIPSLVGVATAAAPVIVPLLALAGAAAALYKAWDSNFLGIQNITEDVLGALGDGFEWFSETAGDAIEWVIDAVFAIPDAIGSVIDRIPGIDSEDVLGDVDTGDISDSLFPPKPGEEAKDIGEEMGDGVSEGVEDTAEPPTVDSVTPETSVEPTTAGSQTGTDTTATGGGSDGSPAGSTDTSPSAIREALEGMALSLSGELPIDGDVATMDDVEARLRAEGRRQA